MEAPENKMLTRPNRRPFAGIRQAIREIVRRSSRHASVVAVITPEEYVDHAPERADGRQSADLIAREIAAVTAKAEQYGGGRSSS
jgi:hypothetical protein